MPLQKIKKQDLLAHIEGLSVPWEPKMGTMDVRIHLKDAERNLAFTMVLEREGYKVPVSGIASDAVTEAKDVLVNILTQPLPEGSSHMLSDGRKLPLGKKAAQLMVDQYAGDLSQCIDQALGKPLRK